MANFFKHVGEYNGKRVILLQRQLPGEAHMCSVIFSQIIPTHYHDDIMRVLESAEGQAANNFIEVLGRRMSSNGRNLLEAIGTEGYLKKVPTNQVIVKPNSKSSVRLDELNGILERVGLGEEASRRLEQMDRELGYRDVRQTPSSVTATEEVTPIDDVLDDRGLARMNLSQAARMRNEAQSLLAEASRLEGEAFSLDPGLAPVESAPKTSERRARSKTKA